MRPGSMRVAWDRIIPQTNLTQDAIEDFIRNPPAGSVVRFETAGDGHEGHWGF